MNIIVGRQLRINKMDNIITTIGCLFIGMLLKRVPAFPKETGNALNLFAIYVSLPALVLLKIPELVVSSALLVPALLPWVMIVITVAIILLLARMLKWDRATTGCFLLLIPLGNTSFLGIPMVSAYFGEQLIPYALLYDQLGSFPALATYGAFILAVYGKDDGRPKGVWSRIFSFPPFLAMLAAFAFKSVPYHHSVAHTLNALAGTLVPVVMIAVGFQLTLRLDRQLSAQLSVGLALKLIAMPLIALLLCTVAGLQGDAVKVSVFETAMPPMVSAGAMAIMADLSPKLTAALVGLGILLSLLTLPVIYQILQLV